jgi:hypothetical protein
MKWFYVTLVLLASSVCLVGWIYLRDRDAHWLPPQPSEHQRALADTSTTRIGRPHCLQIDLDTFLVSQKHGLYGVQPLQPSRCDLHPVGKAKT